MDSIFKIKNEHKDTVVGFNNSVLPLGQRSDLHKLAELAQFNPSLAQYFEKLPSTEEIIEYKQQQLLDKSNIPGTSE